MKSKSFWTGALCGSVVLLLLVLFVVPALGLFNMSAVGNAGLLDWWGSTNWHSSLWWRSPDAKIPEKTNLAEGMEHYRSSCVLCHGAPGTTCAEWAAIMQPQAPALWEEDTQQMSDGELFRVVSHGVRMTGMPAFGPTHSDQDVWNMVAFVRHLNDLSENEKNQLEQATASEDHHHKEQSDDAEDKGSDQQAAQTAEKSAPEQQENQHESNTQHDSP